MRKKQFKAESKRLLEMMINSIYTHKEIFLRELISNASDAIDKLYFNSLSSGEAMNRDDFAIDIKLDKENRTITISDNGIGMTKDELENNLGTIAKSGSLAFKKENETGDDVSIIGQFGVGFYSAFMVAKEVSVTSKAYGEDTAYKWVSDGADGYTVEEAEMDGNGSVIVMKLKDNGEDENYDEYLQQAKIQKLVKKYSDYIRYPIRMDVAHQHLKDGTEDEYELHIENQTLNSMVPLWKKNKNELIDDDYVNFYLDKFYDYQAPIKHMHIKNEGFPSYDALLYIPAEAPFDYYTKEYERGLQLYSNGVLIMEKCSDLIPDYFGFVKGLVDSEDLSLNISREMLQHDRQLKLIEKSLETTIKNELKKMLKNDRERYDKFFKNFGLQLKLGVYSEFGVHKETLQDLIMFRSSFSDKLTTLSEYVSRMKEDQKYIYFANGDSVERIKLLPQTELIEEKGYEILYFLDNVDEFVVQVLMSYEGKEFKSIASGDLNIETEEEKKEIEEKNEKYKDMFIFMQGVLDGNIKEVRVSQRLKTHPVCISTAGALSMEMEKILNNMPSPTGNKVKAEKILEINPTHDILPTLAKLYDSDKEKLKNYTKLLYTQALLIEGVTIENPVELSKQICELMVEVNK
ncbi:MAG: molecular chaperone HtpG [Ruminococcus sp.]|nr:molecular chaperone HtpG [Ruminococcus sp.]